MATGPRAGSGGPAPRASAEIERAEPVEGEDIELLAEEERLANADALHTAATTAHEALLGDPSSGVYDAADATSLLAAARTGAGGGRAARRAAGRARGPRQRGGLPARRCRGRARLLRGVGGGRPGPARRGPGAPRRPDPADQRRTAPGRRAVRPAATWRPCSRGARRRRPGSASWTATTTRSACWPSRRPALAATVAELAAQLTAARTQTAARFAAEVTAELAALAMPHAQIVVAVTAAAGLRPARRGRGGDPAGGAPGRRRPAAEQGRVRRRAVPGHAGHRGGVRRRRSGADVRVRRG